MHLVVSPPTYTPESTAAVDLGQTPGDIVILTAADTELAALSSACGATPDLGSTVRLANWMQLTAPASVDLYVQAVVRHARTVVLRLLGGVGYWRYGLSRIAEVCSTEGIDLIVLPGDDKPDPELSPWSTVDTDVVHTVWMYLVHGGARNYQNLLRYLDAQSLVTPPASVVTAGLYWPGLDQPDLAAIKKQWSEDAPVVPVVFYRALLLGGTLAPIDTLCDALQERGLHAVPIFVSSLKDPISAALLIETFKAAPPSVIINTTGFAVSRPGQEADSPLDAPGVPVLQAVLSGGREADWRSGTRGLNSRDLAMHVALPELDGRLLTRAISFKSEQRYDPLTECSVVTYQPALDRIDFVAEQAKGWADLQHASPNSRRVALVLANYPNRDGRLGNGVGLDTPAGTTRVLKTLARDGYDIGAAPTDPESLMSFLSRGPTNTASEERVGVVSLSVTDYERWFQTLPKSAQTEIYDRWGLPIEDPFVRDGAFVLALHRWGNVVIGVQPARGYNIDPVQSYHDPDLVPPHGYLAFYLWVRESFGAHAIIHMGKHGNAEWLPGKALALSNTCYPEIALGTVPHIYPFIVNDPGEGSQAKRRTSAVIIDHMTPPLTRAESYGPLRDLEALVDEYFEAVGVDPRRVSLLQDQIFDHISLSGLDHDCGIMVDEGVDTALNKIDGYLCELKEMQIRDGLHVFGESPAGQLAVDTAAALVRIPRNAGDGQDASLPRSIAVDLALGFDPLDCDMSETWTGLRPEALRDVCAEPWRTVGDTVERIELLALKLIAQPESCARDWPKTQVVIQGVQQTVLPVLALSGPSELNGIMTALDGRFVAPGPSGAPTRGRLDVLPTGRNFYSVDSRTVPTQTAWTLGFKSAALFAETYRDDHGHWPRHMAMSAWGTANMRTGGDDIAQALALMGAKPVWDGVSRRVTGIEVIPLIQLGRPRVDVTVRVSGFFRDAFPQQMALLDQAVQSIAALSDEGDENPLAQRVRLDEEKLIADGVPQVEAATRARFRVFGAKPGAYGAGLQALIDEGGWSGLADFSDAFVAWGGYAYTGDREGVSAHADFETRLRQSEAVLHNQDNREHDLLDSDDYYQFEGGLAASISHLRGSRPASYHGDHSRPERPVIRSLSDEIGRVVRARAVNPKWLSGVQRHGYKGAFEVAATVDYTFAFAATTGAVKNHHFDLMYDAYVRDDEVRNFMAAVNPAALAEMAARFDEAIKRGLWTPRRNDVHDMLSTLHTGA